MDLSIIIVTWNSRDYIAKCLISLDQGTIGVESEVIVIDNGSHDSTMTIVRDQFPHVRAISLAQNMGFAHACNVGIAAARGRFIGFLNPDTELLALSFTHLVNFMDRHPGAAVSGGKLLNPDYTIQASVHVFPSPLTALGVALKLHKLPFMRRWLSGGFESTAMPHASMAVDYVKGAFFITRSKFLHEVGGFDERYFLWFDEVDLERSAHERGWDVFYHPKAQAIHWGAKSFTQVRGWHNQKQFLKSMSLYLRKWHGLMGALPVLIVTPFILAFYRFLIGRMKKNN